MDKSELLQFLRHRFVIGASDWLSGKHGSKRNDKEILGYTDQEWEMIWTLMLTDGAWAMPSLKDSLGNNLKENLAPEMLIKFIAHDLKTHIIVFDLHLQTLQFVSGNHIRNNNVVFESPLLLYATGSHFQAVFQRNHEFFIQLARDLDSEGKTEDNSKLLKNEENIEKNEMAKETNLKNTTHNEEPSLESRLNEIRKIKTKDRPVELQKEYKMLMKRRNRAAASEEKTIRELYMNKERIAKKRKNQSQMEKNTDTAKSKECMAKKREIQPKEKKEREASMNKERMSLKRKNQSKIMKDTDAAKSKECMAKMREMQTKEKADIERVKNRERQSRLNRQLRSKVFYKEAFHGKEIMEGNYEVQDLKDTNDRIGAMNIKCQYCKAYKFKKESPTTCCSNGKVILQSFPSPPDEIMELFKADTTEGRIFRENARTINNAVCLTSIKVKNRHFDNFNPSVIFEGRVQQLAGPLQAAEGEKPCFAQLYVHDSSMETGMRFKNMTIPSNMSKSQKKILEKILKTVQDNLHRVNPFIRDIKQIIDIPASELEHGKIVISAKARPKGQHERRYNPQLNLQEVSILTNNEPHDLVLQLRGGELQSISDLNPKGMPLHFTLLFPHGTYGWDLTVKQTDGKRRVTTREFYVYHLNLRETTTDFIHLAGRLFQEWICMAWVAVENQKLMYQRMNQKALRADTYINIREATERRRNELAPREDGMFRDDNQAPAIGRKILSSSFAGSPRWYNAKFQDGMAICREYHKPDFFITMTCNPHWPEIKAELIQGQSAQDRPDIVARVFKLKKDQLMQDIKTGGVLGKVVAHMHVVEFQKRGLPHIHILVILADNDRNITPEMIDSIVVAEIPPEIESDEENRKSLREIVLTNMIHGPCGAANPNSPCMENGQCTKKYPKEYQKQTSIDPDNNFASYRRRSPEDGGLQAVCPKTYRIIDNSWVVPYCPFLSIRFDCHINIEFCVSPKATKYLYKYVTKGSDRAMVRTIVEDENEKPRDEIAEYEDLRSVGSSEATWHLMSFSITERYPPVQALRVHLEDHQQVVFDEGTEELALEKQRETELTGFFKLNVDLREANDVDIMSLPRYVDLPKKYRYDKAKKIWVIRQARSEDTVIGRVHTVNPLAGETFYLRILLHHDHCRGKTSFQDLKVLDDGKTCETFKDVCCELGLLKDDLEWQRVLEECAGTQFCSQIREVYVIILMFCQPANPRALFDEFWPTWTDDFDLQSKEQLIPLDENQLKTMVLLDLEMRLQSFEKGLADFGLPEPTLEDLADVKNITNIDPVVIREEKDYCLQELVSSVNNNIPLFTPGQAQIFETVMHAVKHNQQLSLFIDARGGCGKTFLLNALLSAVRSSEPGGCVALAMATTGIAANLLKLGRTYLSRMKAPLTPTEESTLQISAQSSLAKLIRIAKLLLIDESTMLDRYQLEALDRSLRDLMGDSDKVFGGKVIVLAGDFRQCLPVVPRANRATTVGHCINKSRLWQHFKVFQLTENMRVRASGDPRLEDFDKWTLGIGNGVEKDGVVPIPSTMLSDIVPNTKTDSKNEERSMKKFCQEVFPNIHVNIKTPGWLEGRTILAPTNREVDTLNEVMQGFLAESGSRLLSADTLENPEDAFRFNSEYLNTLKPNGFPHHVLNLKSGMPIMLLRNINPRQGLCNGTRLIFEKCLDNKLLQCRIVETGRLVLIPRITFIPKPGEFPFEWQRRQFPVRPAFAMTINKSQGQTLKFAGIWLRGQVFTHGQLYVACSRVGSPNNLKFALMSDQQGKASNIVFHEVLLSSD